MGQTGQWPQSVAKFLVSNCFLRDELQKRRTINRSPPPPPAHTSQLKPGACPVLCVQNNVSTDAALGQAARTTHTRPMANGDAPAHPAQQGTGSRWRTRQSPATRGARGRSPLTAGPLRWRGGGWAPTCKTDRGTGSHRFHRNTLQPWMLRSATTHRVPRARACVCVCGRTRGWVRSPSVLR